MAVGNWPILIKREEVMSTGVESTNGAVIDITFNGFSKRCPTASVTTERIEDNDAISFFEESDSGFRNEEYLSLRNRDSALFVDELETTMIRGVI